MRVISATNSDLPAMIRDGTFREDLYYRLNVIELTAPPLRSRREDVPLLIDHFLGIYCQKNGRPRLTVSPTALARLTNYPWPGNVRELENVVERASVLARSSELTLDDLPVALRQSEPSEQTALTFAIGTPLTQVEQHMIRETLRRTAGDKALAAQLLGISQRTIYRKLEEMKD